MVLLLLIPCKVCFPLDVGFQCLSLFCCSLRCVFSSFEIILKSLSIAFHLAFYFSHFNLKLIIVIDSFKLKIVQMFQRLHQVFREYILVLDLMPLLRPLGQTVILSMLHRTQLIMLVFSSAAKNSS